MLRPATSSRPFSSSVLLTALCGAWLVACGAPSTGTPGADSSPQAMDAAGDSSVVGLDAAPEAEPQPDVQPASDAGLCDPVRPGTVRNFIVDGRARSFILTVPRGATGPGGRWPVVFNWHGLGDNAANMNGLLSGQVNNGTMPFILVTPSSTGLLPFGNPIGLEWEQLKVTGTNRDARLFDSVLECLGQRYGVDEDRVYTVGFSAGAIMSDLLGVLRGPQLAAIVSFSGGYFSDAANPPMLSTFQTFVGWPQPPAGLHYAQLLSSGGTTDQFPLGTVTVRFDRFATGDLTYLNGLGHDVIKCDHGQGHTVPSEIYGPEIVQFLAAHPRNVAVSPWAAGLPSGWPSFCTYHAGTR